jgi:hypothetical protein
MYDTQEKGLMKLSKGLKKLKMTPSLLKAIIQGIQCWTDDVEYNLDERSHPILFMESHKKLLQIHSAIGLEYFMKGYIAKDWGHIQESYYKSIRANMMKFTRSKWVLKTLTLLHIYRTSLWYMHNASLHGGHANISKQVFRQ